MSKFRSFIPMIAVASLVLLVGCSTAVQRESLHAYVDQSSVVDVQDYNEALDYCTDLVNHSLQRRQNKETRNILLSTLFGAAVGNGIAAARDTSRLAGGWIGSAIGAGTGALINQDAAVKTQKRMIRNCLATRGYELVD